MSLREQLQQRFGEVGRIADALVLCLTRGMSLNAWRDSGVLEREWALYERLKAHYGQVVVFSYGDTGEAAIVAGLGAAVVTGDAATGPLRVREALLHAGVKTAVVKTNQFEGGDAAIGITRELRAAGITAALIARGGYPWSRFEAWKHGPDSPEAARAGAEEGDLCRCADAVIGTTASMVNDLAWRFLVPKRRSHVVPNYITSKHPPEFMTPRAPGTPVILAAGRLEPQKRFSHLIHSVATSGVGDKVILRIVGDGPLRAELAGQAERECLRLELPGRVRHEELLAQMRACELFVQCSKYEGHPKTVLEAMGSGACVVVTNTPGLGDVVEHEKTGWVVPDSEYGLEQAIGKLMDNEGLRRKLGEAAYFSVWTTYDVDTIAQTEARLHASAMRQIAEDSVTRGTPSIGAVRWDPSLLRAPRCEQAEAFRVSINGFARRLATPREKAAFLLSLDDPIYQLQGPAAIEAEEHAGRPVHPKHRLMRYHDFFVERIKPGERVIDLGSGVGALAASIAQLPGGGASVTGVEIEPANIEKARRIAADRGLTDRITYVQGDITAHRAEGTFDAVVLSNVLEHIKDRPTMLRRWTQWYRPSRFLIRVPAFDRDWKVPFKKELGVEWRLDDTHEIEYTRDSLQQELREGGLEATDWVTNWGEYWVACRPVPDESVWRNLKLAVFDFDGVMSNNQVLVMQDGTEGVLCNRSDGLGLEMLRKAGFSMLVLSKEQNPVVSARCRKLKLECMQGVDDKLPALQKLAAERGLAPEHIAYVGNDVNDTACMGWVGLPIAVADAFPACKAAARFITTAPGGQGAVREVCERIMRARAG